MPEKSHKLLEVFYLFCTVPYEIYHIAEVDPTFRSFFVNLGKKPFHMVELKNKLYIVNLLSKRFC